MEKKIILTRAQEQLSEASEMFIKSGAKIFDLPALVIKPPDDWGPLDDALKQIETFEDKHFNRKKLHFLLDDVIDDWTDSS